jgi:hypothetical protein
LASKYATINFLKLRAGSLPKSVASWISSSSLAARCLAMPLSRTTFTTSWTGVSISCYENGIRIEGNRDGLLVAGAESVKCVQSKDTNPQSLPSTLACDIDSDAWVAIDKLAFKTYAPQPRSHAPVRVCRITTSNNLSALIKLRRRLCLGGVG